MNDRQANEGSTGSAPAAGQQHGSSSGEGGTVGPPDAGTGTEAHHPRPDTPESKVEHQADQPGVTGEDSAGADSAGSRH